MDPKAEGGGGDANDNTNGNSEHQQQQQQQQPPFGMPVMMGGGMGGMMGGMGGQAMMDDILMAMGMGHPGSGISLTGIGGIPPGYVLPPSMAMPPWEGETAGTATANGGGAESGKIVQRKGKKSKKDEQQPSANGTAKRKRNSNDGKNAASPMQEVAHIELMTESWKKDVLDKFPRCKSAEGIRETSYFATAKGRSMVSSAGGGSNINCLRKLLSELNRMEYEDSEQLPGGAAPIWLRYDDECPQYMRALITGPPRDTPYSNGLFAFDIYVPDSYPNVSPKVQLLTTGGGTVGFSPNLYKNGKVCLSLLGTWSGPKWVPGQSSILQILVSIQGLILVEHPYYMEGYGGWEGKSPGNNAAIMNHGPTAGSGASNLPVTVRRYEDNIRMATMKYAMAEYCRDMNKSKLSGGTTYLAAFEDIIRSHFRHRKECILADAKNWVNMACSQMKRQMKVAMTGLELVLGQSKIRVCVNIPPDKEIGDEVVFENPNVPGQLRVKIPNNADMTKLKFVVSIPAPSKEPPSATMETTAPVSDDAAAASLPATVSTTVDKHDSSNAGKPPAVSAGGSSTSPETAAKLCEMEAAAAKGDYITAGRIQSSLELSAKVHDMIVSRKREMDDAAAKKDYVEAGRLQLIVKHLESNRMRLQELERRMFECASRQDFVKAGRFQEQYRVLMMESAEVDNASRASGAVAKAQSIGSAVASAVMGGGSGYAPMLPISGAKTPASMMMVGYGGDGGGYYDDHYGDGYDY